jgi:SAM-dependent methyltransferase
MARHQRESLKLGQTSPGWCADFAIEKIKHINEQINKPLNILDIGCGSGNQMSNIQNQCGKDMFSKRVGLDWSPVAVERLHGSDIYDEVKLCQSSKLPFADKEFDIAISIENLEHLYVDDVKPALEEMMRIAKYIVVVTPNHSDVINHSWLNWEIHEASIDPEPIDIVEFQVLEGAVHKSVVIPESMVQAGFEIGQLDHGRYFAESDKVDLNKIVVIGIHPIEADSIETKYQMLLRASLSIDHALAPFRT